MKGRTLFGGLCLLLLAAAGVMVSLAWRALGEPFSGWSSDRADVVLEPGMSAGAMLHRLEQRGVIRDAAWVRAWLSLRGGAERLHAGEYRFDRPATAREVLARLAAGDVLLHEVTLPEGLTAARVATALEGAGFGERAAFAAEFASPGRIADLDPEAEDLEGYLYPETYRFPRGTSPSRITDTLVAAFREVADADFRARAAEVGLEVREAVILASLIERETSVAAERARISRVFHNRLERRMRLECDPTVRYALERAGRPVERLTYGHLRFDSPWNTYVVHGLPRGPIANPGRASLEAAIAPDDGDELYFVAAPAGGHRFSTNLADHLAAVRDWRRHRRDADSKPEPPGS